MDRKKKPLTVEAAIERMASLCSRSEHCEFEIYNKLIKLGLSSSQRQEVIDYLKENRYLDNARYAKSFANDKAKFTHWGPYKIKAELSLRRIPSALITEALKRIDNEVWETGLMKCAESKARNLDLTGDEASVNCRKLYTYLASRGFATADVSRAVKTMRTSQKKEE